MPGAAEQSQNPARVADSASTLGAPRVMSLCPGSCSSGSGASVPGMADFNRADLRGSRFELVDLSGAQLRAVDLTGALFRGVDLSRVVMRGVELVDVDI